MRELTTDVWHAAVAAIAALNVLQADAVLGCELMADVVEAVSDHRGVPYQGDELAEAADALLHRRP